MDLDQTDRLGIKQIRINGGKSPTSTISPVVDLVRSSR